MAWNWQSPDWQNFTLGRSRMAAAEVQFLLSAGAVIGRAKHSMVTGASPATTTSDLADLTEKSALVRTGERKQIRYALNLARG
jgi:hypothetical protein